MLDSLQGQFLGNTWGRWLLASLVGLVTAFAVRVVLAFVVRRVQRVAEHTAIDWDDVVVAGLRNTKWFSYLAAGFYAGSELLHLSERLLQRVDRIAGVLLLLQIGFWFHAGINARVKRWKENVDTTPERATAASAIGFIARLALWAALLLAVMSTLGIQITALIAGLGVGGVAAALAVQTLLADVIASLSIYFDRPFDIGEFIATPDGMGTVQRISMRSTRLRALGGEELIFSNGQLLKQTIRNFGRMAERRIVFEVGVEYGTPVAKLKQLPEILGGIVAEAPDVRLDRAHFKAFGAYALIFEVVYYVQSPDFNVYMDRQQLINFAVAERFEALGVAMAFPTQTLMLRQDEAQPPKATKSASSLGAGAA
ncbi:MAG: mechanosensitive ion channel family protein [Myxococcales bacterium]|nr:mechanosensitive ion channel family protein [Myxococcales bacterium]